MSWRRGEVPPAGLVREQSPLGETIPGTDPIGGRACDAGNGNR